MVGRLLQLVGVVAVLGLVAGSVALVVGDKRVQIVADEKTAPSGPDPMALLRDDVRGLHADIDALTIAVATNLERLQQNVDVAAGQRHDEVRRELAAAAGRMEAIERRLAATPAAAAPAAAATVASPAEVAATPPPAAATAVQAAPAKPAGSAFLSFQLPNRKLEFDRESRFEIVGELSRVGFDAKSTLHDFSGVTQQVRGSLRANLADPEGRWAGSIACSAATLATGVDGRDAAMREHLDTEHFPELTFEITGFTPATDGIDVARMTVRGEVRGSMTIRGRTRDVQWPVALRVDESKRLCIDGQVAIKMSDFGVPVPSQLGLIKVQDELQLWVALRARPVRGDGDGR